MNLKELRENAGLKQRELADISGVNLRSLQDYEQGHKSLYSAKGETLLRLSATLGCSIEDILYDAQWDGTLQEIVHARRKSRLLAYEERLKARKRTVVHFPVIAADDLVDMSRIYPTKQLEVKNVLTQLREDSRVSALRVFGSSITMACHQHSDIDFAVGITDVSKETRNDISEKIQSACGWNADIVWIDRLSQDERIHNEIMKGLSLI